MPARPCWTVVFLALSACSDVPEARWPEHVDFAVSASYELGADRALVVPFSREDLTIFALEVAPPPVAERFANGRRSLVFAPEVAHVELRCKGRRYGSRGADLAALFPGAARLEAQ